MKTVPTYGKILTLGSAFTENALVGEISIQEKVDGSLFGFGTTEHGEVVMRSKGAQLFEDNYSDMFRQGVEYIMSIRKAVQSIGNNTYFYCEYLQKPKHNTLVYKDVPTNHLVLFDVVKNGKYATREELEKYANFLGIDLIPELYRGDLMKYLLRKHEKGMSLPGDYLKAMTETTTSFLGNETIEGIVVKNYHQTILLGGNVFPLFTKYVREAFRERHSADWKIRQPKDSLQDWMEGFRAEARWQKALIHAKEKGILQNSPRDIGPLLKMIQEDIVAEEEENIRNYLYKAFIGDILRKSVARFPEWYKDQLLKNI